MKRQRAVFTIQQNEEVFLPIWLEYYRRHFRSCDIYVIDHDSTSSAVYDSISFTKRWTDVSVVQVHNDLSFSHNWLAGVVAAFQQFLLRSYEMVLFTEIDEIVTPDPALGMDMEKYFDFIASKPWNYAKLIGHEVIHHVKAGEPAIDLRLDRRPLLGQRKWWAPSYLYSKPLLSRVPLEWHIGFHDVFNRPAFPFVGTPLHLLHLHRLDFELCKKRHESNLRRKWDEQDLQKGAGFQNRITDEAELLDWYYNPSYEKLVLEEIPEKWKEII